MNAIAQSYLCQSPLTCHCQADVCTHGLWQPDIAGALRPVHTTRVSTLKNICTAHSLRAWLLSTAGADLFGKICGWRLQEAVVVYELLAPNSEQPLYAWPCFRGRWLSAIALMLVCGERNLESDQLLVEVALKAHSQNLLLAAWLCGSENGTGRQLDL